MHSPRVATILRAAAAGAVALSFCASPASAFTLTSPSLAREVAAAQTEKAYYYHHRYYRHRVYNHGYYRYY